VARKIPPSSSSSPDMGDTDLPETAEPSMAGGASGVVDDTTRMSLPGEVVATAYRAPDPNAAPAMAAQRFRVGADATVMYSGAKTLMRKGKIIDAGSYDLDLLRRQGVILTEEV